MDRALLLVAVACYLAPLLARDDGKLRLLAARWWVPAGVLLHIQGLLLAFFVEDLPLRSMTEGLGLTALALILAREAWGRRPRMALLQRILLGVAVPLLLVAALAPRPEVEAEGPNLFFLVHIGLVLTGFAGFALTFSMSTLYLVVRRRLKAKRLADLARLPSLDTLDALMLRTMAFGFGALTLGIASGFAYAIVRLDGEFRYDLTTVMTMVVWLWYLVGLGARLGGGWRGRVVALFGVGGFVAFLLITGVGLIVSGWHGMV